MIPFKKMAKCFLLFIVLTNAASAQVKIGSAGNPNVNAVLELDGGTSKGLLLPRLTTTQITALNAAPDGMMVYNITDGFLYIRKNAAWQKITDATTPGAGFSLPYEGIAASSGVLFNIQNTGNSDAIWGQSTSGDGLTGISTNGNGGYFTSYNGNALVTLSGNVGIGTATPAFKLDVNGRARFRSVDASTPAGIWFDKFTTAQPGGFFGTFNDSVVGVFGANAWRFFFDYNNSFMGINQSAPKAPLSFSNANGNKLDIYYGAANSRYGIGLQAGLMQLYSAGVSDDIAFGYGSSSSFTEHMRVRGNGNVGIGTVAPSAKLEVRQNSGANAAINAITSGTGYSVYAQSSNANPTMFAYNTSGGPSIISLGRVGINNLDPVYTLDVGGRMRLRSESGGATAGFFVDGTSTAAIGFIGTNNNNTIGLWGSGSNWSLNMNTNTGNIGIGTDAPNSKLQVAGGVSMPITVLTDQSYNATDNDYSVHVKISNPVNIFPVITLPAAANRRGRLYVISANIPQSGTGANKSKVTILEAGTGVNVLDNLNLSMGSVGTVNYLTNGRAVYNIANYNRHLLTKQTSVTVQSDGTKWIVITNDFVSFDLDDYYD